MLFRDDILKRIPSGEVTRAYRRWRRPTVKTGGRLRTPAGEIGIDRVEAIEVGAITEDDARAAGSPSLEDLRGWLTSRSEGEVYRIDFHYAGPDRRAALRQDADLAPAEIAAIAERLAKMDERSGFGPWTRRSLELIAAHPAKLAEKLGAQMGRDKPSFKRDIRRLKELGLTESLDIGYRLSPRGEVVLAHLRESDKQPAASPALKPARVP
ncbi:MULTISPECIES: hypothetical protein [Rhodomicrobium]|uniref:hypothetical protein n=1 Tax=Rhodomicrobium TaxID=1068 RepID=UPI000B4BB52E|nr:MULTISPECIES: hypothetical protein [Rhodomicrobium]